MSEDATRERMQVKTFTAWVNSHLKADDLKVTDLAHDFSDGVKLIRLVEIITQDTLGKYKSKPVGKFQMVENLNLPLRFINDFLKTQGISNQYSAENILEENLTLILGMVWSLILRFNVSEISEGDRTAKEGLLLWAQNKVREGSKGTIEVSNFHTSWQDGMAFNALIQAFRPDLVDISTMHKIHAKANLDKAFDIAEKSIGIPKMLDSADMLETVRPDEKSVMTYISFFWKEFAANKRKTIAAVQRELQLEQLIAEYIDLATSLDEWLKETHNIFATVEELGSIEEAEAALRRYMDYGREGKPAKFKTMQQTEVLFSSIASRLGTLNRSYSPPSEFSLESLQTRWRELSALERGYEESLKHQLNSLRKASFLSEQFIGKAVNLEEFIKGKAAWLVAGAESSKSQMVAASQNYDEADKRRTNEKVVSSAEANLPALKPENFPTVEQLMSPRVSTSSPRVSVASPPSARVSIQDKASQRDESLTDKPTPPSTSPALVRVNESGATASSEKPRIPKLRGLLMAFNARSKSKINVDEQTPRADGSTEVSSVGSLDFSCELEAARTAFTKEPQHDSMAAVQARKNMLKAAEEEIAGRAQMRTTLLGFLTQLHATTLPKSKTAVLQTRLDDIDEALAALSKLCEEYSHVLDDSMSHQQKLEDCRLQFARRAEALNRWFEETGEKLVEAVYFSSISDARAQLEQMAGIRGTLEEKKRECETLAFYEKEIEIIGVKYNPYSRFTVMQLSEQLEECVMELTEREEWLKQQVVEMTELDQKKKDFATEAEGVAQSLRSEKQKLEELTPPITINADAPESVATGKRMVEELRVYSASATERKAMLEKAQLLSDELFSAGELDNPYSAESMGSLTSALDALEQLCHDKQIFLLSQIAAAEAYLSPEQKAEAEKAFHHFDKSGDGVLNMDEFAAVVKSMDFENTEVEMEQFIAANSHTHGDRQVLGFDAFCRFLGEQYKSKDSLEGLLEAFKVVCDGKDVALPENILPIMQDDESKYLLSRLEADGMYYSKWSHFVYGKKDAIAIQ